MELNQEVRERIEQQLQSSRVVLFMKGTPQAPMCGFSAQTVGILDQMLDDYASVNVLADESIREGIKVFGQWPTIPQLYVDQELVGGCDIVTAMYNSGELHELLGQQAPDRTPPEIHLTDAAAQQMRAAVDGNPGMKLHFKVDGSWRSQFHLAPAEGHELVSSSNGLEILTDLATAQRARGAKIDWVDSLHGQGLSVELPEAPPAVSQITVEQLRQKLNDSDDLVLVDVRPEEERQRSPFEPARGLDSETTEWLEGLPHDRELIFICAHGNSSLGAGEHFRRLGFTNVHSVTGGIQAWEQRIEPS